MVLIEQAGMTSQEQRNETGASRYPLEISAVVLKELDRSLAEIRGVADWQPNPAGVGKDGL